MAKDFDIRKETTELVWGNFAGLAILKVKGSFFFKDSRRDFFLHIKMFGLMRQLVRGDLMMVLKCKIVSD